VAASVVTDGDAEGARHTIRTLVDGLLGVAL